MKNSNSTQFYNWLGAMSALLIAVVLGWTWRNTLFNSNPPVNHSLIQQEEVFSQQQEEVDEEGVGEDDAMFGMDRLGVDANLGVLYNAEYLFRGENGHYTTDLVAIGWEPSGILMNYKLGFLGFSVPIDVDEVTTRSSTDEFLNINERQSDAPFLYSPDAQMIDLERYRFLCRNGCTAGADHFEIMIGIPLDNRGRADIWLFDDQKRLIQVWDGIRDQQLQ